MQIFTLSNSLKCKICVSLIAKMQIFIFLRNASLYKECLLAHVNVFFKKVSLYHYSALLSLLCSDNQHVCCSDALPYTPCNVSSMYHDL